MPNRFYSLLFLAVLSAYTFAGEPRTLVVNTTSVTDESEATLTLPEAVQDLNINGPDGSTILFNIPGSGPFRIALNVPLNISRPMTISGATQPGFAGTPIIEIFYNSSVLPPAPEVASRIAAKTGSGLEIFLFSGDVTARAAQITGNGVTLRSLSITGPYTGTQTLNSTDSCVTFVNGSGHAVEACYIGLTPTGAVSASSRGLFVQSSVTGIRIGNGGTVTNGGNVIGGNQSTGIYTQDSDNVLINGNRIGVLPNGTNVGNGQYGIYSNTDTAARAHDIFNNIISNNGNNGIHCQSVSGFVIQGNTITGNGFDVAFDSDFGSGAGIVVENSTNVLIGTNGDNVGDAAEGNLISGNGLTGVSVGGSLFFRDAAAAVSGRADPVSPINGTRISGNTIGLNAAGAAQPNGAYTTANTEEPDYTRAGIHLQGNVNVTIGTDKDGSAGDANEGNTISANTGDGVLIEGESMQQPGVAGRALPEGYSRVVAGNRIGTSPNGLIVRGNDGSGVRVDNQSSVLIGGTQAGTGNLIANNTRDGVTVTGDSGVATVTILGNSITANTDRGIDLGDDGFTPNDAIGDGSGDPDFGPNGLSNFPVLTSISDDRFTIAGSLTGDIFGTESPTIYRVEFYSNPDSSPDQGQRFLGSTDVTLSNTTTFSANFTATLTTPAVPGSTLSATATRLDSFSPDTSEFYAPIGARLSVPALAFASNATFTPPSPFVGDTVTFNATATISGITVNWDFGDGATGTGATTTHVYGAPGVYTVTVTLLDAPTGTSVTSTLQVPVTAAATPNTPSSVNFRVRDLNITLSDNSNNDMITVNGLLNLPKNFTPAGKVFTFDIGGVQQSFTLKSNGRATVGRNTLFFPGLKKGRKPRNQDSSFVMKLRKGSFTTPLKTGALNPDASGLPGTVVVRVSYDGQTFNQVVPVKFTRRGTKTKASFGRF